MLFRSWRLAWPWVVLILLMAFIIGLVVETQCRYFSPITFPDTVHAGLRVAHLGTSSVRYAGSLEFGADAIYDGVGLGLRIDVPDLNPSFMAQIRYSVFYLPTLRLLAAASLGVQKPPSGYEFNRAYELLLGARASLGVPYVGLDVGGANNWPDVREFKPFGKLTVGLSF